MPSIAAGALRLSRLLIALVGVLLVAPVARADEGGLPGPVAAQVERVIDGDTVIVRAQVWLDQEIRVAVRIDGIDAPELSSRCDEARKLAVLARELVDERIGGRRIELVDIRREKYFGRVIARIRLTDGEDLADLLIATGLARPYSGRRRCNWCAPDGLCPAG